MTALDPRAYLAYDPETGVFTCAAKYCDKIRVGQVVGSRMSHGYIEIRFDGRRYTGHRLAWWWMHGEWPKEVDHRNTIRSDNRIANLRSATHSKNVANAGRRKSSGFKGVYPAPQPDRWHAKIKHNYKPIHLGVFVDEETAARAYDAAAVRHFGEFAHLNFPAMEAVGVQLCKTV